MSEILKNEPLIKLIQGKGHHRDRISKVNSLSTALILFSCSAKGVSYKSRSDKAVYFTSTSITLKGYHATYRLLF